MTSTLPSCERAAGPPARVPRQRVRVVTHKWPDRPHWQHDALLLGTDQHGTWLGAPVGTPVRRPGAGYVSDQPTLTLVPRHGSFLATFYERGGTVPCEVYVDVTSPPRLDAADGTVTAVDLDLDVVRGRSGRVWVDDDDEFAARRVRDAYPADLVRRATSTCEEVRLALTGRCPPYDGTAAAWFQVLAAVVEESS